MENEELKKLVVQILEEKTAIDYGCEGGDDDYVDISFSDLLDVIDRVVKNENIVSCMFCEKKVDYKTGIFICFECSNL